MIADITAKAEQELGHSYLDRRSGSFALVIASVASFFSLEMFFFSSEDGEENIQITHNKWDTEKKSQLYSQMLQCNQRCFSIFSPPRISRIHLMNNARDFLYRINSTQSFLTCL